MLKSDALEADNTESQREEAREITRFFWRDLNRVPLCSSLLRMLRNGGMDYTREAPGGCCPAALYYDRKVRKKKRIRNKRRIAAASRIVFSMVPSPPFLSCASRIFCSMVPSPPCLCCGFFLCCSTVFPFFFSSHSFSTRRQLSKKQLSFLRTWDGAANSLKPHKKNEEKKKEKFTCHFMCSSVHLFI